MNKLSILLLALFLPVTAIDGQDRIHYTGKELSNPAAHDGQLSPVVGVHNLQVMRANREHPDVSNGNGWTYNHQPMLAYWNGRFYMHYLSDPSDEHVPPSQTFLMTSEDGYHWTDPDVLFPPYRVPDGYTKESRPGMVAKDLFAIMHQRVGFYVSKSGRLIAMANYGVAFDKKDDPNDGNGIGRVVREIKKDGSYGPIYFIYYNHGFNEKNTAYPPFRKSKDKAFVAACREILDNPLYWMQWVEEADREDPNLPLKKRYKAFNAYTLPDGRLACLWKHALTSVSEDGGHSWAEPVLRAEGFVNSNAKIWGQRLSDGMYATVYNPSEFRWPLAISLSKDGLEYTTLNLVNGEIPPMRYGGNYKSYGPQYARGIQEGNGKPEDGNLWVTYSMNKEDIWISRIPVPVRTEAGSHAKEDFSRYARLADLTEWNIYSPLWAPVSLETEAGNTWLTLRDKDPFDYAKVERKIPASRQLTVSFDLMAGQNDRGTLQIEFLDADGIACSRIELTSEGILRAKGGSRFSNMMKYEPGKTYHIQAELSVKDRNIRISVDGRPVGQRMFYAPVASVERILFRTGNVRMFPTPETPADQEYDLPGAGKQEALSEFRIANFSTASTDADATAAVLKYAGFRHYADAFNAMEDENIVQAIPNAKASEWMEENIPLFECPQKNFEEMYYFRWWSLRKHIKDTPVGYGMTECGPIICYEDWKRFKPGSCGKAAPRMDVQVLSSDPENIPGEIVCKGPNVMLGYYKNEEATEQVVDKDGWLHTGDLALKDAEGNITIKGRSKNMLLGPSGQNIYPEEIEDKLNNLPYVSESIIVQQNDKLVGLVYPDFDEAFAHGLKNEDMERVMEENRVALNAMLPAYSQISKMKIYPEEFEKTPKKSIKRFLYQEAKG